MAACSAVQSVYGNMLCLLPAPLFPTMSPQHSPPSHPQHNSCTAPPPTASAITAAAAAVDTAAAAAQVPGVLRVLLDRLRNEITRLPAVRAFGVLAASPLELPALQDALEPALVSASRAEQGTAEQSRAGQGRAPECC